MFLLKQTDLVTISWIKDSANEWIEPMNRGVPPSWPQSLRLRPLPTPRISPMHLTKEPNNEPYALWIYSCGLLPKIFKIFSLCDVSFHTSLPWRPLSLSEWKAIENERKNSGLQVQALALALLPFAANLLCDLGMVSLALWGLISWSSKLKGLNWMEDQGSSSGAKSLWFQYPCR